MRDGPSSPAAARVPCCPTRSSFPRPPFHRPPPPVPNEDLWWLFPGCGRMHIDFQTRVAPVSGVVCHDRCGQVLKPRRSLSMSAPAPVWPEESKSFVSGDTAR